MRFSLLPVLVCATAYANPRIASDHFWMASERLAGTISASNATIVGTFSFVSTAGRRYSVEEGITMHMELPIWLPDPCQNPALQSFWQAYKQNPRAPETLRLLEEALYMRAEVGGNVVHTRQASEYDGRGTDSIDWVSARFAREHPQVVQEPGFRRLLLDFLFSARSLQPGAPVTAWVAYRQPLAPSEEGNRFFYVPFFANQPPNASTSNTNRHSITITASSGCSLAISNGRQTWAVSPGRSATLSPMHCQCIRVTAKPMANSPSEVNGRQPRESETNATPAAAASRRSP